MMKNTNHPRSPRVKIWNPGLLLFLLTLALFSSGCSNLPSADTVTFTLPIQANLFSPDKSIEVQIWNAEQVQILEQQAGCVEVVTDQTSTLQCPDGVTYQEVVPETFTIPVQELGNTLQVESKTVKVGEIYRIVASGPTKDDCNSTSFANTGTAETDSIRFDNPTWMTTLLTCLPETFEITPTIEP